MPTESAILARGRHTTVKIIETVFPYWHLKLCFHMYFRNNTKESSRMVSAVRYHLHKIWAIGHTYTHTRAIFYNHNRRSCRDGSAVKSTCCSLRRPRFSAQLLHGGSPPITSVPRDPVPSSDLQGSEHPCGVQEHTCGQCIKRSKNINIQ